MLIETLQYTSEEGSKTGHDVVVFALSTCGFCKSCLQWLHDNNVKFKYIYYDLLDGNVKDAVKDELKTKYNERVMFPFVVVDGTQVVVGFKEDKLRELLA